MYASDYRTYEKIRLYGVIFRYIINVVFSELRDIYALRFSRQSTDRSTAIVWLFLFSRFPSPKQTLMQRRNIYEFSQPLAMENSGIYSVVYGRCLLYNIIHKRRVEQ